MATGPAAAALGGQVTRTARIVSRRLGGWERPLAPPAKGRANMMSALANDERAMPCLPSTLPG